MSEAPQNLEDVIRWIVAHDARVNTLWDQQHSWNKEHDADDRRYHHATDLRMDRSEARLSTIERRIAWIAGAASIVGALGGTVIAHLFGV